MKLFIMQLHKLPSDMKKSWFVLTTTIQIGDFEKVLKIIFEDEPAQIFDIGWEYR